MKPYSIPTRLSSQQRLILSSLLVVSLTIITRSNADQFGDSTYESDGTEITILDYTGPGGKVTVPDTTVIATTPQKRVLVGTPADDVFYRMSLRP